MKSLRLVFLTATFSSLLAACGGPGVGPQACEALLPGDLVITEIMGNPNGTDTGNEWFEIYNASSAAIDLQDLTLIASRADTTGEKTHQMVSTMIGAGEYLVVGDVQPGFLPAFVDYGYGADLGGLLNAGGRVAIFCGGKEIDNVIYETMASGVARGFTGSMTPDYIANDTLTNWCDGTAEYMAMGFFGSPGTVNENCPGPQGTCDEAGTIRDVNKPVAGDLVITEVMPDPSAVADTAGEWMEVLVVNAVDLNGVEVGSNPGTVAATISDPACLTAAAGTYLVFAQNPNPAMNGGLTVDYDLGFSLVNGGDTVFIGIDGTVLDEFTYTASPTGASNSLDPDFLNPTDNDNEANWCDGITAYGAGDFGTPGVANDQCPIVVGPGQCDDNGTIRNVNKPVVGDLVITELMPNPNAVSDANGEWMEVLVVNAVDLNGVETGSNPGTVSSTVSDVNCLPVMAGTYLVFANNANMLTNGGVVVDYALGFALVNGADSVFVGIDNTVLDQFVYTSSVAGSSKELSVSFLNPIDNDNELNWCSGVNPYGSGDLGTPGMINTCP